MEKLKTVKFNIGKIAEIFKLHCKTNQQFEADQLYGKTWDQLCCKNPIIGFIDVPNNSWGAGVSPIWKNGTTGHVKWTGLALSFGLR